MADGPGKGADVGVAEAYLPDPEVGPDIAAATDAATGGFVEEVDSFSEGKEG